MIFSKRLDLAIATALLMFGFAGTGRAANDAVDPAQAKGWAFMQSSMPGVPYDMLKTACTEGALTVYSGTWTEAEVNRIKLFEQHFPCIKVTRLEMVTASLRARFQSEFNAHRPTADIIQDTEQGALDKEAAQGYLMNYKISNESSYPANMMKSGYWYPLRVGLVGIAWNTTLVTDDEAKLLSNWNGLIDPRFKNRIGIEDASAIGMLPWYMFNRVYGASFISQLGAQNPRIFASANPLAAALASGDVGVIIATETGVSPLWSKGAPIRWSFPEPAVAIVTGQAIPANAPHPGAAKLYQEYSFTLEGYTAWQLYGGAPSRLNYKDPRDVAAQPWYKNPTKFFQYTPADFTRNVEATQKLIANALGSSH